MSFLYFQLTLPYMMMMMGGLFGTAIVCLIYDAQITVVLAAPEKIRINRCFVKKILAQ